MEKEAAIEMFLRSVDKRGLKYITYIGDGDSSSYGMVAQALKGKYSDQYVAVKEDRIGHTQKRMGSYIRILNLLGLYPRKTDFCWLP